MGKPFKFLWLGGKGGVGKSLNCASVARILARKYRVAVIDADLEGSNTSTIFGVSDRELKVDSDARQIIPILVEDNIALVNVSAHPSIRMMHGTVLWDPRRQEDFLRQVLTNVKWPFKPEFLFIDCPAGVGQAIPALKSIYKKIDGAVLVTIPAKVATENTEGVIVLLKDLKIPILGILSNMSHFNCPSCGHKEHFFGIEGVNELANRYGINIYGELPFDPEIPRKMDKGLAVNHGILVDIARDIETKTRFGTRVRSAFSVKQ